MKSKHNLIIGTYFHGQNVEKHKKDKTATLSFPKFVSFYHFCVPEGLRISKIFFVILLAKIFIDNWLIDIFIKNEKDKKTTEAGF